MCCRRCIPSKIVFDQSNVPGTGYIAGGPSAVAGAAHVPIKTETDNVPINDASSVALRLVDDAGPSGAVVLNFTPPEALVILQAAQKLGLENRVKAWACSTPCNTDFLAKALGPKWNHKFFVNAELTPPQTANGPEMQLYKAILAKYGSSVTGGIGTFSQMGFLDAEMAASALEKVKGAYTLKSVNAALKAINGLSDRAVVQAVYLRQLSRAHPQQHRLHRDPQQRVDGRRSGMHRDLLRRSPDRRVPQDRRLLTAVFTSANFLLTTLRRS